MFFVHHEVNTELIELMKFNEVRLFLFAAVNVAVTATFNKGRQVPSEILLPGLGSLSRLKCELMIRKPSVGEPALDRAPRSLSPLQVANFTTIPGLSPSLQHAGVMQVTAASLDPQRWVLDQVVGQSAG